MKCKSRPSVGTSDAVLVADVHVIADKLEAVFGDSTGVWIA